MPGGVELPKVTRKRLAMWWWNFLEMRISTLRNKIERLRKQGIWKAYRVSHFQFGNFESLYFETYLT